MRSSALVGAAALLLTACCIPHKPIPPIPSCFEGLRKEVIEVCPAPTPLTPTMTYEGALKALEGDRRSLELCSAKVASLAAVKASCDAAVARQNALVEGLNKVK